MARKLKSDRVLFIATLLLVSAGIVMVSSASAGAEFRNPGAAYDLIVRQVLWVVLGICVLALAMRVDYRAYRADEFIWTLLALVVLMLVAVLAVGPSINGATRWLGVRGLGIQPSELAKLACVLFTALVLERRMRRINEIGYSLLPLAIVVGGVAGLILLQNDLGTAVAVLSIVGVMTFSAGLRYRYVIGALAAIAAIVLAAAWVESFRWDRLVAYMDPWAVATNEGYQSVQSQIAVGTGGVMGRGLGGGVQKLLFLPYPETDFIYAVIGEELGLAGATAVLACYCVIAWRGLRIALRAEDAFGALVAIGLTTMIGVQALVNISVVLSLVPTKGFPLPLVSYGGSSMLVSLLAVGVLLNISQYEVVET